MPSANKVNPVRGMRDVLSADYRLQLHIQQTIQEHFRVYGYAPIDLPVIENTELYLRKSGEEIASRMYEFNFKGRRIALRPEMTASVIRTYIDQMQDHPLPLRLQYAGSVFRYEKPQQHRYRQFTMAGVEMIGINGAVADAEMLYLACQGLEKLGIPRYTAIIGHTGILQEFLDKLGLRKQLLNFLIRNMENIRKRGMAYVIDSLREIFPNIDFTADDVKSDTDNGSNPRQSQQLINVLRQMSDDEAHQAVTDFLHSLNIRIDDTSRDERDVIDRLLHKIREDHQGPKLKQALEFMHHLSDLVGKPEDIIPRTRELINQYQISPNAVNEIEQLLETLTWYGDLNGEIVLDFGMNRGLHYYTGLMFELHQTGDGEDLQLCGGGRYDNLVSVLGGSNHAPAIGFAYGIERIASVLASQSDNSTALAPDVFIIPISDADLAYTFKVATELRASGHVVEVSITERNVKKSLKHADKIAAPIVLIIGQTEREANSVVLRDMINHQESTVELGAIHQSIKGLLAHAQQ